MFDCGSLPRARVQVVNIEIAASLESDKRFVIRTGRSTGDLTHNSLAPIYYRDANGALLVYDITDRDSFTKVRHWVKELRKIVGKNIVLVIAGNKADMEKKRQVDEAEADAYAVSVGAIHMGTSAKTGKNVENAFLEMTKGMLKMAKANEAPAIATTGPSSAAATPSGGSGRGFVDITKEQQQPTKTGCCS